MGEDMFTVGEEGPRVEVPPSLVAAGGWCAPSDLLYDVAQLNTNTYTLLGAAFPAFRVLRPGTPEYEENQRTAELAVQQAVAQVIGDVRAAQERVLERAYYDADFLGLDVLWQEPHHSHTMWRWSPSGDSAAAYRFVGISLVERSTEMWRQIQGNRAIIIRETAASDSYYDEWDD